MSDDSSELIAHLKVLQEGSSRQTGRKRERHTSGMTSFRANELPPKRLCFVSMEAYRESLARYNEVVKRELSDQGRTHNTKRLCLLTATTLDKNKSVSAQRNSSDWKIIVDLTSLPKVETNTPASFWLDILSGSLIC